MAMVTSAGESYTYHYNGVGSTVALTDNTGTVKNSYAYSPSGTVLAETEELPQPFKFVGKYGVTAEPVGLYHMRARYYDPQVGRFISEDPIGFAGGDVNLYGYVGNNPVNFNDPTGLFTAYGGWGAAEYSSKNGSATYAAGPILYSDEAGFTSGAFYTSGSEKAKVGDIRTAVGLGGGEGPVVGFFTGPLSGFEGESYNATFDAVIFGVTYSSNSSECGISFSACGKGFGAGYHLNTTNTMITTPNNRPAASCHISR